LGVSLCGLGPAGTPGGNVSVVRKVAAAAAAAGPQAAAVQHAVIKVRADIQAALLGQGSGGKGLGGRTTGFMHGNTPFSASARTGAQERRRPSGESGYVNDVRGLDVTILFDNSPFLS